MIQCFATKMHIVQCIFTNNVNYYDVKIFFEYFFKYIKYAWGLAKWPDNYLWELDELTIRKTYKRERKILLSAVSGILTF